MKKIIFTLVILLLLPYAVWADELTWPPPPEMSRIKFVQAVRGPSDLKIKKSFFKKIWEFVAGDEPEGISRPFAVAVKGDRICVTDMALSGFHLFDLTANNYKIITPKPVKLTSPVGAVFTGDERLLIADSVLKKVFAFSNKGDFAGEFSPGFPFQRPTAVAVSPLDNSVWVSDTLAHQILKFSPVGEKLLSIGVRGDKKGEFNYPTGITIGKDGRVYICDTLNARLQVFSPTGKFLFKFGKHGDSTGDFANPKSVALDGEGHIYIVDGLFDAVQIFDEKGRLLLVFGQRGTKNGEFYVPSSIVIDEKDRIFVSDSYNGRIQIFQYLREF
ncbi:MAG: 6-bladed beta-propeller [Proteobacteria bacterium]|nr:6-bladed beta-propeller [Pseudomonadota bacterium]